MQQASEQATTPPRKALAARNTILTTLLIALAFLWLFHYLLFDPSGARILGSMDMWWYVGPTQHYLDTSIHDGELPLWNPLILCGVPFAGNPGSMMFYPPNLLRSLLVFHPTPLNTHISLAVLLGAHFIVMGLGLLALARQCGLSRPASWVATLGLLTCGACVREAFDHPNFVYIVSWMPLLFVILGRMARAKTLRSRLRWTLLAGLVYGLQVLVGFPQVLVCASMAYPVYYLLCRVLQRKEADAPARPKKAVARTMATDFLILATFVVIGALLASVMLLPAKEYGGFSLRTKAACSPPPPHEPTFLEMPVAAIIRGGWVRLGDTPLTRLRGTHLGVTFVLTVRVGFLLLALASLFHRDKRMVVLVGTVFYVLLDGALGPPFPLAWFAQWFSPFRFSSSSYSAILVAVPLSILAGLGFDAITTLPRRGKARLLSTLLFALAGSALLLVAVPLAKGASCVNIALVALPCVILLCIVLHPRSQRARQVLIALALAGECLLWLATIPPAQWDVGLYRGPTEFLPRANHLSTENTRGLSRTYNLNMYEMRRAVNGYEPMMTAQANRVLSNPGAGDKYRRALHTETVVRNPRLGLFLKRPFWLARQYVNGPLRMKKHLFPAATTVFLPETTDLPIPQVAATDLPRRGVSTDTMRVPLNASLTREGEIPLERSTENLRTHLRLALPRLSLPALHGVLRVQYESNTEATLHLELEDAERGPAHAATPIHLPVSAEQWRSVEWPLLDLPAGEYTGRLDITLESSTGEFRLAEAHLIYDRADENAKIHISEMSPNQAVVELTDLPDSRILTFVDGHYPGWEAYVDDEPVPIYPANEAFKAVLVPKGSHQVRFVFRPATVRRGAIVSCTALFLTLILLGCTFLPFGKHPARCG